MSQEDRPFVFLRLHVFPIVLGLVVAVHGVIIIRCGDKSENAAYNWDGDNAPCDKLPSGHRQSP